MLSKRDLLEPGEVEAAVAEWTERLGDGVLGVLAVSSATGEGLEELRRRILAELAEGAARGPRDRGRDGGEFEAEHRVYRPAGEGGYWVEREEDGAYRVAGRGVELLFERHDTSNEEALAYLEQRLAEIGVIAALTQGRVRGGQRRPDRRARVRTAYSTRGAMTLVVKLGSSIVAADDGELRTDVLDAVCAQVAELERGGERVVMVTSGAIARGMRLMELPERPRAMDELQAASAVGQGDLFRAYESRLAARGPGPRRCC